MNVMGTAALIFALATGGAYATTIYNETFTGQEGKGAIGSTVDTTGVDWTIDLGDANLLADNDQFAVLVNDGGFTVRDTNAGCNNSACSGTRPNFVDVVLPMWLSPIIDITNFIQVGFIVDVSGSGGFELTGGVGSQDSFLIELLIDGVSVVVDDVLGKLTADEVANGFDFQTGQPFGNFSGSTAQFKISANTYASSEILGFDNVNLFGVPTAVPLPASGWLLFGAFGALGLRRRLR